MPDYSCVCGLYFVYLDVCALHMFCKCCFYFCISAVYFILDEMRFFGYNVQGKIHLQNFSVRDNIMSDINSILSELEPIIKDKKGLIFDIDGTLLDSMPMWARLDIEYLESLGIKPEPNFHNKVKMMTMLDASRYIKNCFNVDKEPEIIADEIQQIAIKYYEDELLIKNNSRELLQILKSRGYKMYVATANEYDMCSAALRRNQVMDLFDGLVTCSMTGYSKERPDVYLLACEKMGLAVSDTVVFEDSCFAINTALKAGFTVVGVYDKAEEENWDTICKITDCQVVF